MENFDLQELRRLYADGVNISEFLKSKASTFSNTSEIIEASYDIQSGSYIKEVEKNALVMDKFILELCDFLSPHLRENDNFLDLGSGELTNLSLIFKKLKMPMRKILAFDISWSRIHLGLEFWKKTVTLNSDKIIPFIADIKKIPLPSKSADVVTAIHSLEPNGAFLGELLNEIFRVAKRRCIFFEPCYELNSDKGKKRMDNLGYVKNISEEVVSLGGKVLEFHVVKNQVTPLNLTACYIIEPPNVIPESDNNAHYFTLPGTDSPLVLKENFYLSQTSGLVFPVLGGLPILRREKAILASKLVG